MDVWFAARKCSLHAADVACRCHHHRRLIPTCHHRRRLRRRDSRRRAVLGGRLRQRSLGGGGRGGPRHAGRRGERAGRGRTFSAGSGCGVGGAGSAGVGSAGEGVVTVCGAGTLRWHSGSGPLRVAQTCSVGQRGAHLAPANPLRTRHLVGSCGQGVRWRYIGSGREAAEQQAGWPAARQGHTATVQHGQVLGEWQPAAAPAATPPPPPPCCSAGLRPATAAALGAGRAVGGVACCSPCRPCGRRCLLLPVLALFPDAAAARGRPTAQPRPPNRWLAAAVC